MKKCFFCGCLYDDDCLLCSKCGKSLDEQTDESLLHDIQPLNEPSLTAKANTPMQNEAPPQVKKKRRKLWLLCIGLILVLVVGLLVSTQFSPKNRIVGAWISEGSYGEKYTVAFYENGTLGSDSSYHFTNGRYRVNGNQVVIETYGGIDVLGLSFRKNKMIFTYSSGDTIVLTKAGTPELTEIEIKSFEKLMYDGVEHGFTISFSNPNNRLCELKLYSINGGRNYLIYEARTMSRVDEFTYGRLAPGYTYRLEITCESDKFMDSYFDKYTKQFTLAQAKDYSDFGYRCTSFNVVVGQSMEDIRNNNYSVVNQIYKEALERNLDENREIAAFIEHTFSKTSQDKMLGKTEVMVISPHGLTDIRRYNDLTIPGDWTSVNWRFSLISLLNWFRAEGKLVAGKYTVYLYNDERLRGTTFFTVLE